MKIRNVLFCGVLALGMFAGGFTVAQNPARHPNLAAAQELINQAFDKITAAQQANEYDMEGHAAKAKEHLMQAREEIKLAARAANHH